MTVSHICLLDMFLREILGFSDATGKKETLDNKEYMWSNTSSFNISFNVNGITRTITAGEIIDYNDSEFDALKVSDSGVSYFPLRYFEKEKLCTCLGIIILQV